MISMAPTMPPRLPSDEAVRAAITILAIAADPTAARARLDELNAATAALRDAIAEHDAASAKAAEVAAAQETVTAREQDVASREDALIKAQTQLNVASNALASRDEAVKLRE